MAARNHHVIRIFYFFVSLLLSTHASPTTPDPLSSAATFILRGLLTECGGVTVGVRGAHKLASGAVDGVRIEGRSWCSPGGLRCRELAMEVGEARIDAFRLLTDRQIAFTAPVQGEATITFDAADFAAFLQHPLVGPSASLSGLAVRSGASASRHRAPPPFVFSKRGCAIDEGGVVFGGEWKGQAHELRLASAQPIASAERVMSLAAQRAGSSARLPIYVSSIGGGAAENDECAAELAGLLALWFGQLHVDLDGAQLGPIRELTTLCMPQQAGGMARRAAQLTNGRSAARQESPNGLRSTMNAGGRLTSTPQGQKSATSLLAPSRTGAVPIVRLRMGLRVRKFPSLPPKF